jgi:hypothetical protein
MTGNVTIRVSVFFEIFILTVYPGACSWEYVKSFFCSLKLNIVKYSLMLIAIQAMKSRSRSYALLHAGVWGECI